MGTPTYGGIREGIYSSAGLNGSHRFDPRHRDLGLCHHRVHTGVALRPYDQGRTETGPTAEGVGTGGAQTARENG